MVNGGLDGSTGAETTTANRCRTDFIKVDGYFALVGDVPFNVFYYNSSKVFQSHNDWQHNPFVGNYTGYIRVNCDITGKTLADAQIAIAFNNYNFEFLTTLRTVKDTITKGVYLEYTESGKYINMSGGIGSTIDISSPTTGATWSYIVADVSEGDAIILNGQGGGNARLWGLLDSDNKLVAVAEVSASANDLKMIIPSGVAKLVVNNQYGIGSNILYKENTLNADVIKNRVDIDALKGGVTINDRQGIYDSNQSWDIEKDKLNMNGPSQLVIVSKYTGSNPVITLSMVRQGVNIPLYVAKIGKSYDYATNIYYIPPVFDGFSKAVVTLTIPSGATLDIKEISILQCNIRVPNESIIMHAHLGFGGLETFNSIKGFEMAGRSGFGGCICNPFNDAEGEIWCYHAGNETIMDGSSRISIDPSQKTTAQMKAYTQYNESYSGYPLATFDDFCRICALFGMKPTLSMGYLNSSLYGKMKDTLAKYGLLKGLTLKNGGDDSTSIANAINNLLALYAVFGNDVTYELYGEVCTESGVYSKNVVDAFNAADFDNARKVIEPYLSSLNTLTSTEQKEWSDYAISKGMTLSLIQTTYQMDFEKYVKMGYIEFTSDTLAKMWYFN